MAGDSSRAPFSALGPPHHFATFHDVGLVSDVEFFRVQSVGDEGEPRVLPKTDVCYSACVYLVAFDAFLLASASGLSLQKKGVTILKGIGHEVHWPLLQVWGSDNHLRSLGSFLGFGLGQWTGTTGKVGLMPMQFFLGFGFGTGDNSGSLGFLSLPLLLCEGI